MFSSVSSLARGLSTLTLSSQLPKAGLLPHPTLALVSSTRGWAKLVKAHNFPQRNLEQKNPEHGRNEKFKDGHGVTLYDLEDGERKSLGAVVMRFKRLEWGAWIRPRAGRHKKAWKRTQESIINMEKHVFCRVYHKRRFDRAVTEDYKLARYIPGDPYKVYNDMSWQRYHSIKVKNSELIKKYGPKNYNFPKFVSHYHHNIKHHEKDFNPFYEPPGYQSDISSGIYSPDTSRPQDIMAPDYKYERRFQSRCAMVKERRYWSRLRKYEKHMGTRVSVCSPLRLPVVGTELG